MRKSKSNVPFLLALVASVAIGTSTGVCAEVKARTGEAAVALSSYEVVIVQMKRPIAQKDREGREVAYREAYLVTLKGRFPRDRGLGMELFVGDYRVPEYGGTPDGLYFKIYDPILVRELEGKEFRYRYASPEVKGLGVRFSLKRFQPLRRLTEK